MHVGYDDVFYLYGYDAGSNNAEEGLVGGFVTVGPIGTLNKIPYWKGSIDGYFALGALVEMEKRTGSYVTFAYYYPEEKGTPSAGQSFNITCTCVTSGRSVTFSGDWGVHGSVSANSFDNVLGFIGNIDNTVELTFDPPPDGFL